MKFEHSGILVIDKPAGITSANVVARVKKMLEAVVSTEQQSSPGFFFTAIKNTRPFFAWALKQTHRIQPERLRPHVIMYYFLK